SMNGIPPSRTTEAMRILDKWDKLGQEGVRKELQAAELPITILTYLNDALEKTKNDVKTSAIATQGIMALETIMALLGAQGKDEYVTYDPSLVRGMDYYTGSVFEIQAGITASVGGGGRYDTLIQYFGGPSLPAVGISFGVDRLVDILAETFEETRVEVYVIPIGDTLPTCLNVIDRLRAYGLRVEIDLMRRGISKNMNYANSQGIPVVLILGEDETANGGITLRDMTSGEETLIPLDEKGKLEKEIERRILK
ncbi:MAG: HisS family protein, partial [archaeon]|nr:HisS family protein [archaeon]